MTLTRGPESRRERRRRSLLSGKIVYKEGDISYDCTLVDISTGGARIQVPRGAIVPSAFFLIDFKNMVAHQARVAWSKAPFFGLNFEKSYPLDRSLPQELDFLRQLWIARSMR